MKLWRTSARLNIKISIVGVEFVGGFSRVCVFCFSEGNFGFFGLEFLVVVV